MRKRKGTVIVPYYDHRYTFDWKTQQLISKSDQAPDLTDHLLHAMTLEIRKRYPTTAPLPSKRILPL